MRGDIKEDNFNVQEFIEKDKEPTTKYGDIFLLGKHRLMCGDATNQSDVLKLMNNELADLLLTDPPYNIDVSNSQGMKIENDNLSKTKFIEFLASSIGNAKEFMKNGAVFYIWHADTSSPEFYAALSKIGLIGRKCYMMELDPKYCDVIIKRWETFTGDKAVLQISG